jgi:hypothetical protein
VDNKGICIMAGNGPPKTTCSICGETVLKSQTYHVGDGKRACKIHQGVADQALDAQNKIKNDKKKKIEKEASERKRRIHGPDVSGSISDSFFEEGRKWANETCWFCGKEGRPLRELFERQIVALEKLKLKGNPMAFFNDHRGVIKEAGFPKGTIFLNRIAIPDEQRKKIIGRVRGGRDKQICAEMAGFVLSCSHCAEKLGLKFMPEMPKVDLKTLAALGTLYEEKVGPTVRLAAGVEILQEQEEEKKAAPFN